MKKELFIEIEIPEGIEASMDENEITVKGPEGELKKTFSLGKLQAEIKEGKIVIGNKKSTKTEKKMMNTIAAHVRNMIKGVKEEFKYEMKICFHHFPITVEVQGDKAVIKNFLGEKTPREVSIPDGAEVKVEKDILKISAMDRDLAGQAAANFEKATKIRMRDRRVFQDGIFITNKAGKEM
jgi:large subunit ribosomal protein L6|tara:strand:- start:16930 stop:17472 length:543 start_codon:yes stop_codon:yes gene_type:complete